MSNSYSYNEAYNYAEELLVMLKHKNRYNQEEIITLLEPCYWIPDNIVAAYNILELLWKNIDLVINLETSIVRTFNSLPGMVGTNKRKLDSKTIA